MSVGKLGGVLLAAVLVFAIGSTVRADYADVVLGDNPLAYWRLGEEEGAVAMDQGGGRIHGAYSGQSRFEEDGLLTDDPDTAVGFNGIDSEVQIPDHGLINSGGPYTSRSIELWFRAAEIDFLPGEVGMLYEEGGATRGLNMYVQEVDGAVQLFMTGWNLAEEQWGPIVVSDEIETEEIYHAVMVLDSSSGDQVFGDFDGRITA